MRDDEKRTPHPALVLSTLSVAAVSTAAVFWLLAVIEFQVIPQ